MRMQLINQSKTDQKIKPNKKYIAEKLALAATGLLGGSVYAQETEAEWDFSASILTYAETDRVSAAEIIIVGDKDYSDTSKFSFKVILDSLTGASANGAIEQNTPQTFTRPSGKDNFVTNANSTPLDDTFKDTRGQINLAWTDSLMEDTRYTIGTNLSKEFDYHSISFSGEIARDFNQKNSTLSAGLSFGSDQYNPHGKIPVAFSSMVIDEGQFASQNEFNTAFNATRGDSSDTITTAELLLGWTQIVNRRMLMQFNYGFADSSGYLTDPFKVLSVVDNNGITQDLVYENRPDSRTQYTVFGLVKYHLDESIFDISYRYLTDDWDIQSHTINTHWRFFINETNFLEPHYRFYQQSAAEFYQPFISQAGTIPNYASADYRVGDMTAYTIGVKYGFQMFGDRAEVRLEYYKQTPNEANQPVGIENLNGLELYPKVDAIIFQVNYFL